MSRSNTTENARNPSTRWFEWHGSKGQVYYYDKEAKKRVLLPLPFTFLLLDELATVKGWHEPSESGIFANEVRDTRQEALVVRSFSGQGSDIASGFYSNIRDRIVAMGGYFQASCYIAYKDGDKLQIGNLGFNGAALSAWTEFKKSTQDKADAGGKRVRAFYLDAVTIHGYEDRVKGATQYRIPKFALKPVSTETQDSAIKLDADLQQFLKDYFSRTPRVEPAPIAPLNERHEERHPSSAAQPPSQWSGSQVLQPHDERNPPLADEPAYGADGFGDDSIPF